MKFTHCIYHFVQITQRLWKYKNIDVQSRIFYTWQNKFTQIWARPGSNDGDTIAKEACSDGEHIDPFLGQAFTLHAQRLVQIIVGNGDYHRCRSSSQRLFWEMLMMITWRTTTIMAPQVPGILWLTATTTSTTHASLIMITMIIIIMIIMIIQGAEYVSDGLVLLILLLVVLTMLKLKLLAMVKLKLLTMLMNFIFTSCWPDLLLPQAGQFFRAGWDIIGVDIRIYQKIGLLKEIRRKEEMGWDAATILAAAENTAASSAFGKWRGWKDCTQVQTVLINISMPYAICNVQQPSRRHLCWSCPNCQCRQLFMTAYLLIVLTDLSLGQYSP